MSATSLQFFDFKGNMPDEEVVSLDHEIDSNVKPSILCRICKYIITAEPESISVQGSHFHTFTNPAGMIFDIRCFHHATGCIQVGSATGEHTWFTGYRWQIAICRDCGEHLGWLFRNGDSFYGLITNRLVTES